MPTSDLAPPEMDRWIAAQLNTPEATAPALARRLRREGKPLLVAMDEAQRALPQSSSLGSSRGAAQKQADARC